MKLTFGQYRLSYLSTLVYMAQASEYQPSEFYQWLKRTNDYSAVIQRGHLKPSRPAKALLLTLRIWSILLLFAALMMAIYGLHQGRIVYVMGALIDIALFPLLTAAFLWTEIWIAGNTIQRQSQKKHASIVSSALKGHPAKIIAVLGSYGKTTMKEILATVLAEKYNVVATPGNKNVIASHAAFVRTLTGKEEIIIIEYGEGQPGDISRFAQATHPAYAVITGMAPAHLDRYKTVEAIGADLISIVDFVPLKRAYAAKNSTQMKQIILPGMGVYDESQALGWSIGEVDVSITGTSFKMWQGSEKHEIHSKLVGKHQVPVLAFAAAFARELGLSWSHVTSGIKKIAPYEHRMQPYQLAGGWVIDDTYNGNLEGIVAGTKLLAQLPARRKIYVTPGLVEQGSLATDIHRQIGGLIASAHPDIVVLMENSRTAAIQEGLVAGNYEGVIRTEKQPLDFYTNLPYFMAEGDIVMMQNDWSDNYA